MALNPQNLRRASKVIDLIEEGIPLRQAIKMSETNTSTFNEVLSGVREYAVRYARARELMADIEVDEAKEIADREDLDPQRARNMVDIRRWRASKHNTRVYGERIDLNVAQTISVGEALTEARQRLSTLHPPTLDAEIVDKRPLDEDDLLS